MAEPTDTKAAAYFLARSAARIERLLIINAPLVIVQREIEVARNRLQELERAFGVRGLPAADYLAKVEADPRRSVALQRARERAPGVRVLGQQDESARDTHGDSDDPT